MFARKGPDTMPHPLGPLRAATVFTLAGALTLTGCATDGTPTAAPEGPTRTVQAANGTVTIPTAPERVAVLWRPTLAAATALGHEPVATMASPGSPDQGLTPFLPDHIDGADLRPVTSSPAEDDVDIEALATSDPDLIIGVSTPVGAQTALLDPLEVIAPTVLLEWEGTGSWRRHLEEVAEILNAADAADETVEAYDTALERARAELREAGVVPEETELSLIRLQSETEIRLETPDSFAGQVVDDLGFARPDAQLEGEGDTDFIPLGYEHLERGDGDAVFVLVGSGFPDAPDTFSDGVWSHLEAVRERNLYRVDQDVWGAANHHAALRVIQDVTDALTGRTEPAL